MTRASRTRGGAVRDGFALLRNRLGATRLTMKTHWDTAAHCRCGETAAVRCCGEDKEGKWAVITIPICKHCN